MTQPLFFRKDIGKLVPADDAAQDALSKIKFGAEVQVEIKRPRNPLHHRKFWALANLVANNQEHYETAEQVVAALKAATGHCDWFPMKDGKHMVAIPKSIAFHKMDQTEFKAFYDRCISVVAEHFLPGVESADLRAEVEGFLR
jgi:hypothetical protein